MRARRCMSRPPARAALMRASGPSWSTTTSTRASSTRCCGRCARASTRRPTSTSSRRPGPRSAIRSFCPAISTIASSSMPASRTTRSSPVRSRRCDELVTGMNEVQRRHGRARPGHPRPSFFRVAKTWMPGTRPGMTPGVLALLGALVFAAAQARAGSVEDFYRGKSITLVIGYSVGGGYDLYGRLVARHLGKHIPGQPNIVPQNREGAGSLRAAIYLYNAAPKDGTVIGTFSRSMSVAPLLTEAPFDATKFTWIGSTSTDVNLCMTWGTTAIKTWNDMLTKPSTLGGLGAGADPDIFALMFRNLFGAKIKLVTGYPGTNDVALAMERGEVDGMCGVSWSTVQTRHMDWLNAKKVNIPVQAGLTKAPDLPDVPIVTDLVKDPVQMQMVRLILASQAM